MIWIVILVFAAGAIFAIVATFTGDTKVLGLDVERTLQVLGAGLTAMLLVGMSMGRGRGQMKQNLQMVAGWLAIALVIVSGYAYRFELASFGNRIAGTIVPGLTLFGEGGVVTVSRDSGGHFSMQAKVNGRPIRIMFDTGASAVVLKAEEAEALGFKLSDLSFSVPTRTANGVTYSAAITLPTFEIGGIRETNVRAMVGQKGQLFENLLGMTFLERLASYEVRGDQLILRGRGG